MKATVTKKNDRNTVAEAIDEARDALVKNMPGTPQSNRIIYNYDIVFTKYMKNPQLSKGNHKYMMGWPAGRPDTEGAIYLVNKIYVGIILLFCMFVFFLVAFVLCVCVLYSEIAC